MAQKFIEIYSRVVNSNSVQGGMAAAVFDLRRWLDENHDPRTADPALSPSAAELYTFSGALCDHSKGSSLRAAASQAALYPI